MTTAAAIIEAADITEADRAADTVGRKVKDKAGTIAEDRAAITTIDRKDRVDITGRRVSRVDSTAVRLRAVRVRRAAISRVRRVVLQPRHRRAKNDAFTEKS